MPTLFRCKQSDLVEQELSAMMRPYNLMRELMQQAVTQVDKALLALSFQGSLQIIIDAIPQMSKLRPPALVAQQQQYLLDLLAAANIG